jgi:hypothetical protein
MTAYGINRYRQSRKCLIKNQQRGITPAAAREKKHE